MNLEVGGLLGFIVLLLDVWAILKVFGSNASDGSKVMWIVIILILPFLGFLAWLFFGPRAR